EILTRSGSDLTPADLQARLTTLQEEDEALSARETLLKEQQNIIFELGRASGIELGKSLISGSDAAEKLNSILRFVETQVQAFSQTKFDLTRQRREISREIEQIKSQQSSRTGTQRRVAQIKVDVNQPGDAEIEFSYTVRNAGWEPGYDLRLNE